jgi:hypothetical protein
MPVTAALLPIRGQWQRLDVPGVSDRDHHLLICDQVLDVNLALGVGDLGPALVAVRVDDLGQLVLDQAVDPLLVAEDLAQLLDPFGEVVVLLLDLVGLERSETAERQLEDRLSLHHGQLEARDESGARCLGIA